MPKRYHYDDTLRDEFRRQLRGFPQEFKRQLKGFGGEAARQVGRSRATSLPTNCSGDPGTADACRADGGPDQP